MDIAFYTTQELIDELVRRTTFTGVVIHSESDLKAELPGDDECTFKVHFNSNLTPGQAGRLLDTVADYIHRNCRQ